MNFREGRIGDTVIENAIPYRYGLIHDIVYVYGDGNDEEILVYFGGAGGYRWFYPEELTLDNELSQTKLI